MEVKEAKMMKSKAVIERQRMKGERIVAVRHQRDEIARARIAAKKKKDKMQKEQLKKNQQQYTRKVNEERGKRMDTLARVKKMEKMEMELIKRLQNTQQLQQEAYHQLETALGGSAEGTFK